MTNRKVFDFAVIKLMNQKIEGSPESEKEILQELLRQYKLGNLEMFVENKVLLVKIPELSKDKIVLNSLLGQEGNPLKTEVS